METLKEDDVLAEPEQRILANMRTAWVIKILQTNIVSQLPEEDIFRYKQHLYQINGSRVIPSSPEKYVELYCSQVGVIPPSFQ